jgi:small subunit ribosomal protein S1
MVKNPDLVFDKAEEMAAKYREQLRKQMAEKEGLATEAPEESSVIYEEVVTEEVALAVE